MTSFALALRVLSRASTRFGKTFAMAVGLVTLASCAGQYGTPESTVAAAPMPTTPTTTATSTLMSLAPLQVTPPDPDPRVGLAAGLFDAAEASWNMRIVSNTPPVEQFVGVTNSDLAFSGEYAIQGNYNGFQIWNIEDASNPAATTTHLCPASQSDVSVYGNLLFISGEGLGGRIDCGTQGVAEAVSGERLRHSHLRHQRRPEPALHTQCSDLPWLAHAHRFGGAERPGQRLHLCLRFVRRAPRRRVRGMLEYITE